MNPEAYTHITNHYYEENSKIYKSSDMELTSTNFLPQLTLDILLYELIRKESLLEDYISICASVRKIDESSFKEDLVNSGIVEEDFLLKVKYDKERTFSENIDLARGNWASVKNNIRQHAIKKQDLDYLLLHKKD